MSTGDLLFIFAFIVLPTIILVSCIWTLLLIRAGVLLPARRAATYDAATQNEVEPEPADSVESMVAHDASIIAAAPVVTLPAVVEERPVALALVAPEPMPAFEPAIVETVPTPITPMVPDSDGTSEPETKFEHTTDLPIINDAMLEQATIHADRAETRFGAFDVAEPSTSSAFSPAFTAPAGEPATDLEILLVPLDESPVDFASHWSSNGAHAPADLDEIIGAATEIDSDNGHPAQPSGRSRRKSVRPVAQLRPSDEQPAGVRPIGGSTRRARPSNPQ